VDFTFPIAKDQKHIDKVKDDFPVKSTQYVTAVPTGILEDKKTRYIPAVKNALPPGYKCKQTFDYAPKSDELELDPNTGIFTLYHVKPTVAEPKAFKEYDIKLTITSTHLDTATTTDINS
jgi:hypothetical protein